MTPALETARLIDDLMEKASAALVSTDYFAAETLCLKAMQRAFLARDYERMARICMPLQEARRQRRQQAVQAGSTFMMKTLPSRGMTLASGCYLLEPPVIGIEARVVRDWFARKRVPVFVIVREPKTSAGKWPLVGVGSWQAQPISVRVQVDPPEGFENLPAWEQGETTRKGPPPSWFEHAQERLGDAAIQKVDPAWPADHRVEDVLEYLEAVPEHEKLVQLLERTCREALVALASPLPRRRAQINDPFGF